MRRQLVIPFFMSLFLSGCAGINLYIEGKELASVDVSVDGKKVGRIRLTEKGGLIYFSVKPGAHIILLTPDKGSAIEIHTKVQRQREYYVTYWSSRQELIWEGQKYKAMPGGIIKVGDLP